MQEWERSTRRTIDGGRADRDALPRGPNGRALCRWCTVEVPQGRRTFCSDWCVHEWRLRSDSGYVREQILARDKGVCALCSVDCVREWNRIRRVRGRARELALRDWGVRLRQRSSLWDADHIVPVAEGGGECDLANIRTLCLKCHRQVTAALRERLRARAAVQE
jgi:5-methylcytosine-specific restriction enzyme A